MSLETSRATTPSPFQTDSVSSPPFGETTVATSKLNERTGNVYENKGPLWGTSGCMTSPSHFQAGSVSLPPPGETTVATRKFNERTGNVYENKG
jgi:hypothetical protein